MLSELQACVLWFNVCKVVQNQLVWKATADGYFSVASLYTLMVSFGLQEVPELQSIWSLQLPPKIQCFSWFVLLDRLSTLVMLHEQGIKFGDAMLHCRWCQNEFDSIDHILYSCDEACMVWFLFFQWWQVDVIYPRTLGEFL
ncbi:hypothetical protein GQ457_01G025100 [Hibiscus cannabinus]